MTSVASVTSILTSTSNFDLSLQLGLQTLLGAPNSHSSHQPHNIWKNLASVISTTKADSRYSDNFTTKHTSISHIRAEHTPDPRLSHNISQYLPILTTTNQLKTHFPKPPLRQCVIDFVAPFILHGGYPPGQRRRLYPGPTKSTKSTKSAVGIFP